MYSPDYKLIHDQAECSPPSSALSHSVPSTRALSLYEDNPKETIRHRIFHLLEQLRVEKGKRDANTMDYLKLVAKADRHQAQHIRQVFEKVNQRTCATIAQIERKLGRYHRQLQELEEGSQPKSAQRKAPCSQAQCQTPLSHNKAHNPARKERLATRRPKVTRPSNQGTLQKYEQVVQKMKEELAEIKKEHLCLQVSCECLKEQCQVNLQQSLKTLQETSYRQQLLVEQADNHLQGYLDEVYYLKQTLASTEEKMAYLSYERAKEIWEVMETFQSRVTKLEGLQQVAQQELAKQIWNRPREFLLKFISLLLTLATILLVCISTMCAFPWPFFKTRLRMCTSLVLIGLGVLIWQKRHAIATADWQAWVASKWRLYTRDPKPLAEET
ncbi:testis-specific protein TEX28 [Tenrec ecaudatus]|uniref:testis-specific protein TEX28 n=1 Tax=Tenrec ecaudatus TaxID=94439 RepID=UPI003F595B42